MSNNRMSREEMVHQAIRQLGTVSDVELAAFIEREHGVRIEAKFLPLVRASLRAREYAEVARNRGREVAANDQGKNGKAA